ncbi:tetratricopeptide repeat protein [Phaeospirillum tilakii]|uniref:Tetratricopeptide repeat protein n=1 Tax=Phaeospirillum tilakii TaxID=741673 RepID=A0ABW5CCG3_9PROT
MSAGAALADRLAALGRLDDAAFPPAEAALALAGLSRPADRAALPRRLARLDSLAAELRRAVGGRADPAVPAAAFAALLDPAAADESEAGDFGAAVERRHGPPEALALLLLAVGRRGGVDLHPLAFPARLLLRIDGADGQRRILDPADPARPLTACDLRALLKAGCGLDRELQPDHFHPLGNRAVLARQQQAVRAELLRQGRLDDALALVEDLLRVAPDQTGLWREAGLMHLRRGHRGDALAALQQFVQRTGDARARARTLSLMADLRARPF